MIGKTLSAAAAAALLLAAPAGAQKTPPTHEALWMMKRVGAPVLSPDGRQVVFSIVEPAYDPDKAVSDLWLVPADGTAAPRRLTQTRGPEEGVAWSPDSRKIAFSAKRDGDEVEEIYVLDIAAGGEAERVTSVSTGAREPKWRPDGKALLFQSTVYPGALDDEANRKAAVARKAEKSNVRVYEHFPVRFWNRWLDDRRPTIMVQPLIPGAKAKDVLSPTAFAQRPGFAGAAGEDHATLSAQFSPDGAEILFRATTNAYDAAFAETPHGLYRMPAEGGEPRPVVAAAGDVETARFSPDGSDLYFTFAAEAPEAYRLPRLQRVAWPAGGAPKPLIPDFDREVADFEITPDGRTLYLLVPEAGQENLYAVDAAGGRPRLVDRPASGGYTALALPASGPLVLIASWGSAVSPAEIVRIEAGGARRPLTSVNVAAAAAIDWLPPEHFWFESRSGRRIHNMIVKPAGFDPSKTYPLIVLMHGGPASMNLDQIGLRWNPHLLAAPGYVVLMTDYTGSTGFGEAFAQAIKHDPLRGPAEEINQAVDEAARRYPFIDAKRACAAGASYGGHLANWMEATSDRYRCIVSHAGEVDLTTQWGESDFIYGRELVNGGPPWEGGAVWKDQSPLTYAKNFKTPILLSIGERDFRVPIGNTLENWSALQRMQVKSRLLVWPDAWHWITKPEDSRRFYAEVAAWFAAYLGPRGAPPASGAKPAAGAP